MTARPVQLETPFSYFDEMGAATGDNVFTPNDAFFVRWHLAGVPTTVDGAAFRIKVHGLVKEPLSLGVADLQKNFEPVEIAAVCQCSGNSRGLFNPRVAGGEWGNGAMGNALWKGVRLRDILNKAGIAAGAVQVRLNGAEVPVLPATPDFIKALDMDVALGEDVIVAYQMNGAELPILNGYPVRLIVPRMVCDVLDEDARRHRGHRQGRRELLDEARIPDSRQPVRLHPRRARKASTPCRSIE